MNERVQNYSFKPGDLNISERKNGISAFMRIRNGADFLEPTIRSHIDYFDEIVAVYNQCDDATPDILQKLSQEFGAKLRVFEYVDRVFPPGSEDHAKTPPDSPNSLVNYYNFALCKTTLRTVTKLDDDHIAIDNQLAQLTSTIRAKRGAGDKMLSFSGMNLWRNPDGQLSICPTDPVSGGGDIGFFDVREDRYFTHDKRFERGPKAGLSREFCGFLYWHLKYLKPGNGFANYELGSNPNSRYAARRTKLETLAEGYSLRQTSEKLRPALLDQMRAVVDPKQRFINRRNREISDFFGTMSIDEAIQTSVAEGFKPVFSSI